MTSTQIKITDGVVTIELPGLTAVRIDTNTRVIAVDFTSGVSGDRFDPVWQVHDLRDGTYGDFHRLTKPGDCADAACAKSEHLDESEVTV